MNERLLFLGLKKTILNAQPCHVIRSCESDTVCENHRYWLSF